MRVLSLEEKKALGLQILDELDRVCRELEIPYYLAYGTLLGAARHKGFIPWDDDIDVWVPAEHYSLLLDKLEEHSCYTVNNNLKNPDWPRLFAKLSDSRTKVVDRTKKAVTIERSMGVDIFPLGRYQSKQQARRSSKWVRERIMALYMVRKNTPAKNAKQKFFKALARVDLVMGRNERYWQLHYLNSIQGDINCRYIGRSVGKYGMADIHPAEMFEESTRVEFEGKQYPAPLRYIEILSEIYGSSCMELPPESKRVSNHNVDVFLLSDETSVSNP